ncbi:hypothetical protein J4Q44_G00195940 [Coregonus suidteri]|uniref:CD80-like immunoglobulin C2-set domain-containing protein n=1 Tax=Coregonus suidteri TaxID=861788 RepID=A0AAN8LFM1_9TELE
MNFITALFAVITPLTLVSCTDIRNEFVNLGSDVILKCINKTWSEIIYIILNLNLRGRECRIYSDFENRYQNTCNDSKLLLNASTGEPLLFIPEFSIRDEGKYQCEFVYKGGSHNAHIHVLAIAPPSVSSCLEWEGSKRVAVCLAKGGKPAASISWRNTWNSTSTTASAIETIHNQDGSYSVAGRLVLPDSGSEDHTLPGQRSTLRQTWHFVLG